MTACDTTDIIICDNFLDTDNIFLKLDYCLALPILSNLDVYGKTCLTEILEKIDYKFGTATNTLNYKTVNLPFIRTVDTIVNLKDFSESVDNHLLKLDVSLKNTISNITNLTTSQNNIALNVNNLLVPQISDTTNIGITILDSYKTVLQKIVNNLGVQNFIQTPITTVDSGSIRFIISGENSHTITANSKISNVFGNKLTLKSDGLYVDTPVIPINSLTLTGNLLSITGSGQSVELPVTGFQTLSLIGNILKISGVNSQVTLPVFQETPITTQNSTTINFSSSGTSNHVILATAKISPSSGNKLIDSNGLYVNVVAADVLNEIRLDANLYNNVFLDLVNTGVQVKNYRWSVNNSTTAAKNISYVDLLGVSFTTQIPISGTITIIGQRISSFDAGLQITFLGQ